MPRYLPERPLPAYRFVPGENPHPFRDPKGHSYGRHEPPTDETFLWGADLHNQGYWWEAHEAWESIWQTTDKKGPDALLLQGLIQVSAALLKRRMGSEEGAGILLREAAGKLRRSGLSIHRGLDVADYLRQVEAASAGGPPPEVRLALL